MGCPPATAAIPRAYVLGPAPAAMSAAAPGTLVQSGAANSAEPLHELPALGTNERSAQAECGPWNASVGADPPEAISLFRPPAAAALVSVGSSPRKSRQTRIVRDKRLASLQL